MFRTTLRLASPRDVEINPEPRFDPDMGRVLDPITLFLRDRPRAVSNHDQGCASPHHQAVASDPAGRPDCVLQAGRVRPDAEWNPVFSRTHERDEVNVLAFDVFGAYE